MGYFRRISPPRGAALREYIMQNQHENRIPPAALYPPEFATEKAKPMHGPRGDGQWG